MLLKRMPLRRITEPKYELRSVMYAEELRKLLASVGPESKKAPISCIPDVPDDHEVFQMDEEEFDEWAREYEGAWEIKNGHRRFKAVLEGTADHIWCILTNTEPEEAEHDKFKENYYREDASPLDEGRFFYYLRQEFNLTDEEIAEREGVSRQYVNERINALDWPDDIKKEIERGDIGISKARELKKVTDDEHRRRLTRFAIQGGANVDTIRQWVNRWKRQKEYEKMRRERAKQQQEDVSAEQREAAEQFRERARQAEKRRTVPCQVHGDTVPLHDTRFIRVCNSCFGIIVALQKQIMRKMAEDVEVEDKPSFDIDMEEVKDSMKVFQKLEEPSGNEE